MIIINRLPLKKIVNLICLTKHPSKPSHTDEALLLDIDLAILAAERGVYERYEKAIRLEYQHIPEQDFIKGRLALLRNWLDTPVFFSHYYKNHKTAIAHSNIAWAIKQLELHQ